MYNIGYEFLGETRFRSLEVPDFPKVNKFEPWRKWGYPIKTLLQNTMDFKLYKDFYTPIADCRLYYDVGQWCMEIKVEKGIWIINSRTKIVEFKKTEEVNM